MGFYQVQFKNDYNIVSLINFKVNKFLKINILKSIL